MWSRCVTRPDRGGPLLLKDTGAAGRQIRTAEPSRSGRRQPPDTPAETGGQASRAGVPAVTVTPPAAVTPVTARTAAAGVSRVFLFASRHWSLPKAIFYEIKTRLGGGSGFEESAAARVGCRAGTLFCRIDFPMSQLCRPAGQTG